MFPVNSTSVITPPCKRYALSVAQHSAVAKFIQYAGVFNCRKIHGSDSWSQHAYGNAVDLFADASRLRRIANNIVAQATRTTWANKGKLVPVAHVIWATGEGGIWTPDRGWHSYDGYHPATHVHADFYPQGTGTPACAA